MRVLWSSVAFALVVTAAVATPDAAVAAPVPISCGAVITADGTLTHDLRCSSGVGLTVDGNVTLDLGGHRLAGPGAASGDFDTAIGVALSESGTVRIQNGAITG